MEAGGGGREQRMDVELDEESLPFSPNQRENHDSVIAAQPAMWVAPRCCTTVCVVTAPPGGSLLLRYRGRPWSAPTLFFPRILEPYSLLRKRSTEVCFCAFVHACVHACVHMCVYLPSLLCLQLHEVKMMPLAQLQGTKQTRTATLCLSFLMIPEAWS